MPRGLTASQKWLPRSGEEQNAGHPRLLEPALQVAVLWASPFRSHEVSPRPSCGADSRLFTALQPLRVRGPQRTGRLPARSSHWGARDPDLQVLLPLLRVGQPGSWPRSLLQFKLPRGVEGVRRLSEGDRHLGAAKLRSRGAGAPRVAAERTMAPPAGGRPGTLIPAPQNESRLRMAGRRVGVLGRCGEPERGGKLGRARVGRGKTSQKACGSGRGLGSRPGALFTGSLSAGSRAAEWGSSSERADACPLLATLWLPWPPALRVFQSWMSGLISGADRQIGAPRLGWWDSQPSRRGGQAPGFGTMAALCRSLSHPLPWVFGFSVLA